MSNFSKHADSETPWKDFKIQGGGTKSDLRKSAEKLQATVNKEKNIFQNNSLVNGGGVVKKEK